MTLGELLAAADRAREGHQWHAMAGFLERAADAVPSEDAARALWDQAGEAHRRDDALDDAARCLRRALTMSEADTAALASIKLSAVMAECGRLEEAVGWCKRGLVGAAALVARDTLVGHLLALGEVDAARQWLPPAANGPLGASRAFREAQLCRLSGEFSRAEALLDDVLHRLGDLPAVASARGATRAERVEICLFTGRAAEAVRLAEEAMDEQRVGGRRSMAWRAEASRVRALVQAGLTVPQRVLDPGLDFAVERRLLLLEADLRLARSEIAGPGAEQDLERVLELQTGSWIREGRALLALAERRRNPAIARQAAEQLRPSVPWSKRAEALISDLLS